MLSRLVFDLASRAIPRLASGEAMHHRALDLAARGDLAGAERCFELAAACYRRELAVEPLARLRVHQLMTRARANPVAEGASLVEIVRLLNRLDRLESLQSPHGLADARTVLAEWIAAHGPSAAPPAPVFGPVARVA